MTIPEALNELADRVEREEPSYSLDMAISLQITGSELPSLLYTTSLDAAVTLVPEGWSWGVDGQSSLTFEGSVWKCAGREGGFLVGDNIERYGRHKVAAAALCAAALRARAADMQARADDGAPHPSPEQKGSEQ